MLIKIRYLGRRFPRTVSLQGGTKTSFQPNKMVLELEEYDALALLKFNNRLTPDRWEFTVEGAEDKSIFETAKIARELEPKELPKEKPKEKIIEKEKPVQKGKFKGGKR